MEAQHLGQLHLEAYESIRRVCFQYIKYSRKCKGCEDSTDGGAADRTELASSHHISHILPRSTSAGYCDPPAVWDVCPRENRLRVILRRKLPNQVDKSASNVIISDRHGCEKCPDYTYLSIVYIITGFILATIPVTFWAAVYGKRVYRRCQ